MSRDTTRTENAFDLRERLDALLAQAEALIVVADVDGLDLREDLRHGYMQALHRTVSEARAVARQINR